MNLILHTLIKEIISKASKYDKFSSSISILNNSAIDNAGWVSFSYIAAKLEKSDHFLSFFLNLLIMSYKVAQMKKYYYFNLIKL